MSVSKQKMKRDRLQDILKLLEMPHTSYELASRLGVSSQCICENLVTLKNMGKIRICGYIPTGGQPIRVWGLGSAPDEKKKLNWKEKKYTKNSDELIEPKFVPRPDIAAAWMFNPVE